MILEAVTKTEGDNTSFLSKSQQIKEGVEKLEQILEACEFFGIDTSEIELTLLNARKIQNLGDLDNT